MSPITLSSALSAGRRGIALVLTLGVLIVVATAFAALTRLAVVDALAKEARSRESQAESLLLAAEQPVLHWLVRESHRTVLSPEAEVPAIAVLNDTWSTSLGDTELRVTAFDQRGMPSLPMLAPGSPIRSAVPAGLIEAVEEFDQGPWRDSPGLDLLDSAARQSPYPGHADLALASFGSERTRYSTNASEPRDAAVGAFLATHNPPPAESSSRRRRNSPAAINVNTAPIEVVEQALRMAGRAGFEAIVDARSRGEKASVAGAPISEPHPGAPVIVAVSDVWSFRVDATVGSVTRAQWRIYARRDSGWRLVQRLEVER